MVATPTSSAPEPSHQSGVSPKDSFILGIGFAWELGYTIAVPALLLGLGGGYLDKNIFGTSPLFLLAGLLLSFVISFSIIASKIRKITQRMPKALPGRKKEKSPDSEAAREQQILHDLFRPPTG